MKPSLSIVIPVYNSQASLQTLVGRLEPVLRARGGEFELILINDGSRDDSWRIVRDLANKHDWITGIDMLRNYGQHNAILAGIRAARHEWIVTMDDDLQHPPEEIAKLLVELERGVDVVYGTPQKEAHGFLRDIASQVTKLALQKAMGAETARKVSAFRAFRTHLRDGFAGFQGQFVSIDVLLTWSTTRFSAVQVQHDRRAVGESNYTYRKLLTHALNMITGFSVLPLQVASIMGFGLTLFGLVVAAYVIYARIAHGTVVQGYTSLAALIALFSGAQLFALGILGEYLARIHFRMMDRPAYAVRERAGVAREN
ncbi:MAG: glycosyltransferase family 2 protein [Planctomycetes bacterium]|nr:glycosyltransferase family 2 protein [Planctomycetota bacterium]